MNTVTIMKGTRFMMNNCVFEILKEQLPGKFVVKNLNQNSESLSDLKDLLRFHEKGELTFEVTGPRTSLSDEGVRENKIVDFSMLPENSKEVASRRYEAIKPLLRFKGNKMQPYFEERSAELRLMGHEVSALTLRRWFDFFVNSGNDINALVPNTMDCGKGTRLSSELEMIIDGFVETYYAKREKIQATDVHLRIVTEVENKNKFRTLDTKLDIPSYNTVLRRIKQKDPYEMMEKREGEKHAFDKLGHVNTLGKPARALDVIEMDHTKLDVFVVDDETRLPLGRPWLTTAVDKATGSIVGIYIDFHPPSYVSVMKALSHAMSSKYYVKELYPDIKNEWGAYGVPKLLKVDNGKEFRSSSLDDACKQLGIELQFCPPRKPWYKGTVERTFRTLNSQLIHQIPGTTFSNVVQKKDYDPVKNATVGYQKLIKLIHSWIIDEYSQQFHKGIKGVPARLWAESIEKWGHPPLLQSKPMWDVVLGKLKKGSTVQRTGIQFQNLYYNSSALQDLKRNCMKKDIKHVSFKYDPYDISKIHVYDELERKYLEVPCTDQAYSFGLTEFSHRCILRQLNKAKKNVNLSELSQAKERFLKDVEEEKRKTKGVRAAALTQPSSAQIISSATTKDAKAEIEVAQVERSLFLRFEDEEELWEVVNNANVE
ncbi:Mu transposase C-terminal domain-containing protein [Paenibacillus cremeus]|uniref:DDE-type integrase/transposase/recombinase n=1 Tax=Paenibacillus cremeus TaxID=2163881 RepID=A0A559KAH1_9BACL|nr:DDE-type integrase/transposase/recombinase [Paenibacillus cremeus]TVY09093.1 DDE-type integrase/transposase/recombinase [Paenibacillus cremeus]